MKKKVYIIATTIAVVLLLYLNFQYGNYYSSPLEAINHYKGVNGIKKEIETFSIGSEPLSFYISWQDFVCLAHYKTKNFGGKVKYKVSKVTTCKMKIEDVVFAKTYNTSEMGFDTQNTSAERILFGISTPEKATSIKIGEKKPIIKFFKLGEKEYILWYITGRAELDNIDSTILN